VTSEPGDVEPSDLEPGDVEPDEKDWTWVLDRPCPDCGFVAAGTAVDELPRLIRDTVPVWRTVLDRSDARHRPAPGVWSPLEYACHIRDAARVFDARVRLMTDQDDPLFANWDQDRAAVEQRYSAQDPAVVAGEVAAELETIAARFAAVSADQWSRSGRRSNGSTFTVASLGRYFAHDLVHHVWDVTGRRA
jgi:hypothetical protein